MARPREGQELKIRYEKRAGGTYAYQSTSKMVDGRRKSVNIYLGKVDPETGEIMERQRSRRSKDRNEKIAREKTIIQPTGPAIGEYGGTYLLHCIQEEIGLGEDLVRAFGPAGKTILAIGMSMAQSRLIFASVDAAMERFWVRRLYGIEMSMDSGSLSEFTKDVGLARRSVEAFHRLRIKRCRGMLVWDLTTRGTYSELEGMAEWLAVNKDDESLMQVKTGMAADLRGVPVMYRHYPGSFSDMATVTSLADDLSGYGEADITFIADRGMFSGYNVKYLIDRNIKIILPGRLGTEAFDSLLRSSKVPGRMERRVHRNHVYKVLESEVGLKKGNRKLVNGSTAYEFTLPGDKGHGSAGVMTAFLCYDTKKYSDESQALDLAVEGLLYKASQIDSNSPVAVFEEMAGPFLKYFEVQTEGRKLSVSVRESEMCKAHADDGYFVMLASKGITWEDMMSRYDARGMVEQGFDTLKGEDKRFRTGDRASMIGRETIRLVALILEGEVRARLSEFREKFANDGTRTVLEKMGCMYAVSGQRIAIPSKCRGILEEFGFPLPEFPLENIPCCQLEDELDSL